MVSILYGSRDWEQEGGRTYDCTSVVSRLGVIPTGNATLAYKGIDERVDDCGAERFDPHYEDDEPELPREGVRVATFASCGHGE